MRELLERKGFVRRRVLVSAGIPRRQLRRHVLAGELRLLAPDVLALPGLPAVDEDLRVAVVALEGTVSGPTAALLHGWEVVSAPARPVVTVRRDRSRAHRPHVDVRRRDLAPGEVVQRDGLRLTAPLRTVLDCCRDLPLREAVAVADSALRARALSKGELVAWLVALPGGPGRDRVAQVVRLVDPLAGSVLESLCRLLLVESGLTPEQTQYPVRRSGRFVGRVDFAWSSAHLVVEADGFAWHSDRASYRRDRRRLNALTLAGWSVLRVSWEDVMSSPAYVL